MSMQVEVNHYSRGTEAGRRARERVQNLGEDKKKALLARIAARKLPQQQASAGGQQPKANTTPPASAGKVDGTVRK